MQPTISNPARLTILVLVLSLIGLPAAARVTRIDITSRVVVAGGVSFGDTGPYEKLRGTVYFEVDPNYPRNTVVFDLDKAPRNGKGMVEFSADMSMLKPVNLTKWNGALLFEVNNRGNNVTFIVYHETPASAHINDPTAAGDFGNGFLMRRGYVLASVGWEADVLPGNNRLTAQFPVATESGKTISERILLELEADTGTFSVPLSGSAIFKSYEAASTDQALAEAELRMRPSDSPRPPAPNIPAGEVIPASEWSFANCPTGPPGTPNATHICLHGGFQSDKVYQLTYRAINPTVMGLGYATTRDFISFLRNARADDAGNLNPVPGVKIVLCTGASQTGGYQRDFLQQGFNEDEHGRRVCDGSDIRVPGAHKLFLNYRFAQPNFGSSQHDVRYVPDTSFPRTYGVRQDPISGQFDGILKRPGTDPKVFHIDSATEYWQFQNSLVHTDENGTVDLVPPDNVRIYFYSSLQHLNIKGVAPSRGICQQISNPTHSGVMARALLIALDEWVRDGTEPPDSQVPRIDDGTLVPPEQYCSAFPAIPGVNCTGLFQASGERDFGPHVSSDRGIITKLIPDVLSVHHVLVPKPDQNGNDIAGIRHPYVEAPVATLTGWNLRRPEFTDDLCGISGMMIPLHNTREERLAANDPRPSLEELYRDHKGYVKAVAKAAKRLAHDRFLLEEDVDLIIGEADASSVLK
jgi:hypothetical protein